MGQRQLPVDEGIIKARTRGVLFGAAVINARRSCPVDCPQAHGAGLTGGIDFASSKLEVFQFPASISDGYNFRMGSGVICGGDLVYSGGHHGSILHHQSCERPATLLDVLHRKLNGLSHEFIFHVFLLITASSMIAIACRPSVYINKL